MVGIIGTVAKIVGVNMIPLPNKKYNIIYADPAWNFKTYSDKGKDRSPDKHYPVMSIQNIKNLPIQDIADDDCILFMWVTFPLLKQGFEVIDAWGFTYKTVAFNWVKKNKKSDSWFWGLGYWTRANAELCLLATTGSIKRQSVSVHQIIDTRIEKHSKKPDIVRDKIIELVGDLPRIELFARETSEGWDSWGNEI
jgi:N6-adenosine-specific RNA methylase IME4